MYYTITIPTYALLLLTGLFVAEACLAATYIVPGFHHLLKILGLFFLCRYLVMAETRCQIVQEIRSGIKNVLGNTPETWTVQLPLKPMIMKQLGTLPPLLPAK